jgi:flagellar hook-basal body complex protein FliE
MKSTIQRVNQMQNTGEQAIQQLNTGKAESLHEVMIAVEEADISLKMLVQMRNKALQAYEEVMRMQI